MRRGEGLAPVPAGLAGCCFRRSGGTERADLRLRGAGLLGFCLVLGGRRDGVLTKCGFVRGVDLASISASVRASCCEPPPRRAAASCCVPACDPLIALSRRQGLSHIIT